MTPEQAKYLLPIIKAYSEGKTIQIQSLDDKLTWTDLAWPNFVCDVKRYRIKPVVKYRRFLFKITERLYNVNTCCSEEDVNPVEILPNFVRWIDTDWVTENV